jgi:amino acid adenylation domain-containing protein
MKKHPINTLSELLERQSSNNPYSIAISDECDDWRYVELDLASSKLTSYLVSMKVLENDVVLIEADKCACLVVVLYSIIRSGAKFIIVDATYSRKFIDTVVEKVNPSLVITFDNENHGIIPERIDKYDQNEYTVKVLSLPKSKTSLLSVISSWDKTDSLRTNDSMYLALTSGSTGEAKIVIGKESPIINFVNWYVKEFQLNASDRFSMLSGLSHDPIIRDIFVPLSIGATLVIPSKDVQVSPDRLAAWVLTKEISIMHLTPSYGRLLLDSVRVESGLNSVRLFVFGGDQLPWKLVWGIKKIAPNSAIVNAYGATETPQIMSFFHITNDQQEYLDFSSEYLNVPIGKSIDGVCLVILGDNGEQVGLNEAGTIYVVSKHMADGYLEDIESTKEVFKSNSENEITYNTKDTGLMLNSGDIVYLGRRDRQVKCNGYRINLNAIETRILENESVNEARVSLKTLVSGSSQIVAFLTLKNTLNQELERIKNSIARTMPYYMLPTEYILLDEFPLLPNGKTDVQKLDEMRIDKDLNLEYMDRVSAPTARILVSIWSNLFEIQPEKLSMSDNFFELGGNSLLAASAVQSIQCEMKTHLNIVHIFMYPNIRELGLFLDNRVTPQKSDLYFEDMNKQRMQVLHKSRSRELGCNEK